MWLDSAWLEEDVLDVQTGPITDMASPRTKRETIRRSRKRSSHIRDTPDVAETVTR